MSTNLDGLPEKRFYRPDEVADYFAVTGRTIRNWCDCGRIGYVRITSHSIRIPRDEIVKLIRISLNCD